MVIDTIVVWGDYYLTTSDAHIISVRNLREQEFWFKEIIKIGHSQIAPFGAVKLASVAYQSNSWLPDQNVRDYYRTIVVQ